MVLQSGLKIKLRVPSFALTTALSQVTCHSEAAMRRVVKAFQNPKRSVEKCRCLFFDILWVNMAEWIRMPPELRQKVEITPEMKATMITPEEFRRRYARLAPITKRLNEELRRSRILSDEVMLKPFNC
jgi:hypothetical protein